MTIEVNPRTGITEVQLPDGTKAYRLTPEQLLALEAIIDDRLWWDETLVRAKRVSVILAFILGGLMGLALWWPWISRVVQLIIKDVPTN